jgi:acyl-CoA synthetase (AMP-forming)/AMP-acid ligase II
VSQLRWQGAASLPPGARAALVGQGAPFELVTEPVLGLSHTVFARRPRSLRSMLDAQAAATGDLPFLISPRRQWTYREAISDIDATAALLGERYGVGVGERVAIVAANHAEYAILMWAVVTLGAIVTSLNGWWSTPELDYGIGLTSPLLIAGDERRLARLVGGAGGAGVPVRLLDELQREARAFAGEVPATGGITEDSPAVILFTSGTTGRPKGATLSHRNIINFAMVNRLAAAMGAVAVAPPPSPGLGTGPGPWSAPPRGCSIVSSPMFHVSGMIAVLMTGAAFPTSLVFPAPGPWDPGTWLELTAKHGVTTWSGVPTQWWRLLRHPDIDAYDLSRVRTVGSGGAVFPPELVRELHARFPEVRLGNGYGMSETVGLGTQTGGDLFVTVPESVGPAQPTVEVQIRALDGAILPEGEVGEICLRSPSVFLGYWNDPAATRDVLDENRWYRTGDYGRVTDGLLFLESRRRDMIIRGGENIYPIEIENRLVEHPDVDEAAVIGVDHLELGQETKAFVVRRPGSRLTEQQVRQWCAAALAAFKVPASVEFRKSLPYTETGKLVKQQLEREEKERATSALFGFVLIDQPDRVVDVGVDVTDRRSVHHPRAQGSVEHRVDRAVDRVMIGVERPGKRHLHGVVELRGDRLVEVCRVRVRGGVQHHHDPVELRLKLERTDRLVEDVAQPLRLALAVRALLLELLLERALPFDERGGEQVLLGREIPVERAERDTGVTRDVGDLHLVIVAVREGAQRGADDALTARELITTQRLWRGRSVDLQHSLSPSKPETGTRL